MAITIFLKTKPYNTTEKAIWSRPNQPFNSLSFLHYKCTFILRPSSRSSEFKLSGLERQPWSGEGVNDKGHSTQLLAEACSSLHPPCAYMFSAILDLRNPIFQVTYKIPHKAYSLPSSYPSFYFSISTVLRTPKLLPSVRTHLVFLFCIDFQTLISNSLLVVPSVP